MRHILNNKISSGHLSIEIETQGLDINKLMDEIRINNLLYRFIPDLTQKGSTVSKIRVTNSGKKKLYFDATETLVEGIYGSDFDSTDIIVLSEYLLERHRQERGIYTVHSSSVYASKTGILLIANLTGAGKTSLAIYLREKHGFGLFSDEKTLIKPDQQKLVGQVEKIFLEDKTREALKANGVETSEIISIPAVEQKNLSLIVFPILIDGIDKPVIRKLTESQLKWVLYEEFSKDIRLVNGMIFKMTYPLMPIDTQELAEQRLSFATKLSKEIPCYFIQGSLSQISAMINTLI